ncbi:MAG TPA: aminotransferase class I/II-fold pyridoxal phosphate-dependent enzyme, partial [Vicinamibacterales bacterium]|nr:aminotransferase class I/II-fold pyridoxal phosphate-dependent enzyme [Vicinamibacterales bacterium]
MHAIILTAGYGRRMQPLSDAQHKALLPVAGSTILGRIVDSLLAAGLPDILIVTGYRADDIHAFLRERYPQVPFRFVHNGRYADTNNIVSLSLALDAMPLDRDVLLIECDLLFDARIIRRLAEAPSGNVALVDHYRAGMDGTVVAVDSGVITHVFPPHLQGPDFSYADKFKTLNIYRFDAGFCRSTLQPLLSCYANLIDGNCYYELVLGMLVNMQRQRIAAEVVDGTLWAEVDDPNDLAVARFRFEPERRAEVLDRALGGHWSFDLLDFAFMRNAHFPTDAMLAAMRQALPDVIRSYGSTQVVLNEKLGYFLRADPARLQVLHGASQAYPLLQELFAGRRVLVPAPTFGEYRRAFPEAGTYADAPGFDRDALERAAAGADLIVFVNPNSPTGTTLPTAWLHAFAARHPDRRVLVDESFVDFSGEEPLLRRLEREPLPNVVVLTSLSKSLGVPGLRLGCVYSSDTALIGTIGARLPVWNLSAPAEFFLELLLKYRTDLEASIAQTIADRERFAAELAELPIVRAVLPSGGNFLLVRLAG